MKVLVTGGAGFIGSHVVDLLIKRNIETHVLVSGFRSKKHPSIINENAHVIKGDLRVVTDLWKATKNMDFVFHLGAVLSHYCDARPDLTVKTNILGTWNLKEACVKNNVERIIFASSSFVYEPPLLRIPICEKQPTNPKELYGISKLAGEKILKAVHPDKIAYTILRLFNVYGPRSYPDDLYTAVIPTCMAKALRGESLEIHDDGTQSLDYIYVKDVAEAFVACISHNAENEVFNVGSGTATSLNELASLINKVTKNTAKAHYNSKHPAYLKFIEANIQKIKDKVGWVPVTDLHAGLLETKEFFKPLYEPRGKTS